MCICIGGGGGIVFIRWNFNKLLKNLTTEVTEE